ncbi:MAG: HlyD family efflux transporter periplasmic adaptor subunit [Bacteroidota bacterium]
MIRIIIPCLFICLFSACKEDTPLSDAYGNFEATTTTISAETPGKLLFLAVEEGQDLRPGLLIGLVDTLALDLQRKQIQASIGALPQKLQTAVADIQVQERRKANLQRERDRIQRLLDKKAATPKQLDDLNGEITVVEQQIKAIQSQTKTANRSILSEKTPLIAQIHVIEEQIRKSYLYNPVKGRVLSKLTEPYEFVQTGTPLYRIAALDTMNLRVYVDQALLQQVTIGQAVEVLIDQGYESLETLAGQVSWISSEAEFTPKSIQTREDRVHLVYAVKIAVPNPNGKLKIGMPAEVNFSKRQPTASNEE